MSQFIKGVGFIRVWDRWGLASRPKVLYGLALYLFWYQGGKVRPGDNAGRNEPGPGVNRSPLGGRSCHGFLGCCSLPPQCPEKIISRVALDASLGVRGIARGLSSSPNLGALVRSVCQGRGLVVGLDDIIHRIMQAEGWSWAWFCNVGLDAQEGRSFSGGGPSLPQGIKYPGPGHEPPPPPGGVACRSPPPELSPRHI